MNVLKRAQEHWDSRQQHCIEVPEWGEAGKLLSIYFKTPNLSTMAKVVRESRGDQIEQSVRIVVACATDAEGNRLFQNADNLALMKHADPAVVSRIASRIMAEANINIEEAEKNSAAISQD
jgi:hypothetical protein